MQKICVKCEHPFETTIINVSTNKKCYLNLRKVCFNCKPYKITKKRGEYSIIGSLSVEEFTYLINNSFSVTDFCRKISLSNNKNMLEKIKSRMNILNLIFPPRPARNGNTRKGNILSNDEMFRENSGVDSKTIRTRIKDEILIPYQCLWCNLPPIWQNAPITLQLDHINGNCFDNRLENLRFLCPNCHSQTESYCLNNSRHEDRLRTVLADFKAPPGI